VLASEGEGYELSDDEIIKIMVMGAKYKKDRIALRNEWARFSALKLDPKFGGLATLVSDGHPLVLCEEAILLSYNFKSLKEKANLKRQSETVSGPSRNHPGPPGLRLRPRSQRCQPRPKHLHESTTSRQTAEDHRRDA